MKDAHDSGRNSSPMLPDYVRVIRRWSGHPDGMMFRPFRPNSSRRFTPATTPRPERGPICSTYDDDPRLARAGVALGAGDAGICAKCRRADTGHRHCGDAGGALRQFQFPGAIPDADPRGGWKPRFPRSSTLVPAVPADIRAVLRGTIDRCTGTEGSSASLPRK